MLIPLIVSRAPDIILTPVAIRTSARPALMMAPPELAIFPMTVAYPTNSRSASPIAFKPLAICFGFSAPSSLIGLTSRRIALAISTNDSPDLIRAFGLTSFIASAKPTNPIRIPPKANSPCFKTSESICPSSLTGLTSILIAVAIRTSPRAVFISPRGLTFSLLNIRQNAVISESSAPTPSNPCPKFGISLSFLTAQAKILIAAAIVIRPRVCVGLIAVEATIRLANKDLTAKTAVANLAAGISDMILTATARANIAPAIFKRTLALRPF